MEDNTDTENNRQRRVTRYQLAKEMVFSLVTTILWTIDVGTDWGLALQYWFGGWWLYLAWTVALILTPSIITGMWYNYCNSKHPSNHPYGPKKKSTAVQILEFVGTLVYLTPLNAQLDYCLHFSAWHGERGGCSCLPGSDDPELVDKVKAEKRVYELITEIGLIKVIEACLEALPQAMTQTYIVYINLENENGPYWGSWGIGMENVPWTVQLSVFTSIASCSLCLYFIYKTWINGSPLVEREVTGFMTFVLLVTGNFLILVGRIAAFVTFLVISPAGFLVFIIIHWAVFAVISYHSDWEWSLKETLPPGQEMAMEIQQSGETSLKKENLSENTKKVVGSMAISVGYLVVPRGAINYLRNSTEYPNAVVYYWLAYWFMFAQNLGIFSIWLLLFSRNEFNRDAYIAGITNGLCLLGMFLMWIHCRFYRKNEMSELTRDKITRRWAEFRKMYKWLGFKPDILLPVASFNSME